MKKRGIRRLFLVLLALVVIVGTINLPMNVKVAKADGSQQIGTSSAYWEVIDGVLYITGSGNLPDYSAPSNQPWYSVRDSITSISIAPGITGLGKNNFDGLRNITSISVPDSVTSIGQYCFHNTGIESVVINGSNITINGYAFANCKNLKNVSFSGEVHYYHDGAFYGCKNLEAVTFGSINRLGKFDFYNCTKLEKIVINNIPDGFTIDESLFGYDVAGIPANLYIVIPDGKSIADLGISDLNLRSALCGKVVTQSQYDAWKVGDEKITQRNHDFDENTVFTKIDENTHQWTCSTCGGVAQGNHDFSEYEYDSETHTLKCLLCGYTKADDKEAHDFTELDICKCGIHKAVITDNGFENTVTYTGNPMSIGEGVFTVNSGAELKLNWYKNDYTDAELPADTSEDYMGNEAPVEVGQYTLVISADAIIGGETDYTGAELRVAVEIKEQEPESYEEKERIVKMIVARQHNLISDYYGEEQLQSLYDYITLESGQDLAEFFLVLDMYLEDGKYKFVYVPKYDYNFIVTVEDGEIVEIYDTFFKDTYKYVEPQIKHTGLVYKADLGIWQYEVDGVASNYTGLVYDDEIGWCYVTDGVVNFYTGLVYDSEIGWWYVTNGAVNFYTGLVYDSEIGWWYVTNGAVNFYTGLVYDSAIGWWYVVNGAVVFYDGLVYDNTIGWWYVTNGAVNFYTGLVYDSEIGWWYVTNGAVNFYTGLVYDNEIGWWYVVNGAVVFYTGLVYDNEIGWWYVTNGAVNFYTGLVYDSAIGWWYVENGAINFAYTGWAEYAGVNYYVVNGMLA